MAIELDGMIVVADDSADLLIRINPSNGDQTALSVVDGPYGVAVEEDGNILVTRTSATGPFGGPGELIRIHPVTGNQEVVSVGGFLVSPKGLAVVP